MDIKTTCPLGSECEKVAGDGIERCAWYIKMQGSNPQTNEPIEEWRCAMSWMPILAIENNGTLNATNAVLQSMRNENTKRQDIALEVMSNAKTIAAS